MRPQYDHTKWVWHNKQWDIKLHWIGRRCGDSHKTKKLRNSIQPISDFTCWAEVLKYHKIYEAGFDILDVLGDGNCGIWAMMTAQRYTDDIKNMEFNRKQKPHYPNMLKRRKARRKQWLECMNSTKMKEAITTAFPSIDNTIIQETADSMFTEGKTSKFYSDPANMSFSYLVDQYAFLCYSLLYKRNVVVYQRLLKTTSHNWYTFIFHGQDSTKETINIERHDDTILSQDKLPPQADIFLWSALSNEVPAHVDDNHFMVLLPNASRDNTRPTSDIRLTLYYNEETENASITLPPNSDLSQLQLLVETVTKIAPQDQKLKLDSLYITDPSVLRHQDEVIVYENSFNLTIQVEDNVHQCIMKGRHTVADLITKLSHDTKKTFNNHYITRDGKRPLAATMPIEDIGTSCDTILNLLEYKTFLCVAEDGAPKSFNLAPFNSVADIIKQVQTLFSYDISSKTIQIDDHIYEPSAGVLIKDIADKTIQIAEPSVDKSSSDVETNPVQPNDTDENVGSTESATDQHGAKPPKDQPPNQDDADATENPPADHSPLTESTTTPNKNENDTGDQHRAKTPEDQPKNQEDTDATETPPAGNSPLLNRLPRLTRMIMTAKTNMERKPQKANPRIKKMKTQPRLLLLAPPSILNRLQRLRRTIKILETPRKLSRTY